MRLQNLQGDLSDLALSDAIRVSQVNDMPPSTQTMPLAAARSDPTALAELGAREAEGSAGCSSRTAGLRREANGAHAESARFITPCVPEGLLEHDDEQRRVDALPYMVSGLWP